MVRRITTIVLSVSALAAAVAATLTASPALYAWVVRPDGIGPVTVGMRLPALNRVLLASFAIPKDADGRDCFYLTPPRHDDVEVMILHGLVARVDVDSPLVSTAENIHIGSSEDEVRKAYGADLEVAPSHYDSDEGGKFLTYRPHKKHVVIRFETLDGKVQRFYAGTDEAVQLVEGCS